MPSRSQRSCRLRSTARKSYVLSSDIEPGIYGTTRPRPWRGDRAELRELVTRRGESRARGHRMDLVRLSARLQFGRLVFELSVRRGCVLLDHVPAGGRPGERAPDA